MSGICAGTPIEAPRGYKNLQAGVPYHFLRSSPRTKLVTLVRFVQRQLKTVTDNTQCRSHRKSAPPPFPVLERLPRCDFEAGLLLGHLVVGERKLMPPWLQDLEGLDLELADADRRSAVKSHADRIDDKIFTFSGLLPHAEDLIDDDDVERVINRHARTLNPKQNETRVRLWFFLYLAFGRNRYALHYPIHKIGNWDRLSAASDVKRGAPALDGAQHGYNTNQEMHDKIIASYMRECGLGVTERDIYAAAMRKDFGCKTREVERNGQVLEEIYHPHGKPFPQQGIYFYYVKKRFHPHAVRETRLGRNRARSSFKPTLGAFTESSWNLMQRVEADGYRVYQLPRGYVEGSDLPPLVVVTKRDTASGKKTGIGFSQGSETAAAYRMATFCEAIGLEAFGRLFGVKIKSAGKGVAVHDITDRGPGATPGALSRDANLLPVVRELAPAYAGQGKALIETSNPKTPSNDEAPAFERSNLTVIQLVRRELFELIKFNRATNVASRIDPDLQLLVKSLSPDGIWEALELVGRNDAVPVGFDDAVRAYLELVPAVLRRGGVELAGRNYHSNSSEFLAALASVGGDNGIEVKAYVLTACIRHVWFSWNGRLIELDVRYPVPVDNEVKYMSLAEAMEYSEHMEARRRMFGKHQQAVNMQIAADYEDQTGLKWDAGQRVSGRPKRGSVAARQEAIEAARGAAGKKAA